MNCGQEPGIDKPISRLVLGTMLVKSDDDFRLLDKVFALGCTTFDSAHGYGNGASERTLGRWLLLCKAREKVVIITQGAHHNIGRRCVTTFDITSDLYGSLARLNTDYTTAHRLVPFPRCFNYIDNFDHK